MSSENICLITTCSSVQPLILRASISCMITNKLLFMWERQKILKIRLKQYFAKTPDPRPFVLTLPHILSRIH